MIVGKVEGLHPTLPVTFQFPQLPNLTIEFVVDTGFVGFLALPAQMIARFSSLYMGRCFSGKGNLVVFASSPQVAAP